MILTFAPEYRVFQRMLKSIVAGFIFAIFFQQSVFAERSAISLFEVYSGYYYCKNNLSTVADTQYTDKDKAAFIKKGWQKLSQCKGVIYYREYQVGDFVEYPVRHIDVSSFKPLLPYLKFAKDKNSFYYQGNIIKDVDPKSLELIGDDPLLYFKDEKGVYIWEKIGRPIKINEAHAPSFKVIGEGFAKDRAKIFLHEHALVFPDAQVEVESFEPLGYSFTYFKDKNNVYLLTYPAKCPSDDLLVWCSIHHIGTPIMHMTKIENADPKTFRLIDELYGKDKNNIYYRGELLNRNIKVDTDSFVLPTPSSNGFSKDKYHVFTPDITHIVEGADPISFTGFSGDGMAVFGRDKNAVYTRYGKKLDGIDPESFRFLGYTEISFFQEKTDIIDDRYWDDPTHQIVRSLDPVKKGGVSIFEPFPRSKKDVGKKYLYSYQWQNKGVYLFQGDNIQASPINPEQFTFKGKESASLYIDKNAVYYINTSSDGDDGKVFILAKRSSTKNGEIVFLFGGKRLSFYLPN